MLDTKSESKLQHFAPRHVAFLTRRHCTISSHGHIMKEHVPSKAIQNITKRLLAIPQYQRKEVFSYGMETPGVFVTKIHAIFTNMCSQGPFVSKNKLKRRIHIFISNLLKTSVGSCLVHVCQNIYITVRYNLGSCYTVSSCREAILLINHSDCETSRANQCLIMVVSYLRQY